MNFYNLPENFTVTAHTGCLNTQPNTLESIVAGFGSGADITEIDIRFLPDGTPVLSHNPLPRKSSRNTAVRLSDALELFGKYPRKKMNLDIKETRGVGEIEKIAREKGVLNRIFFTGVRQGFIPAVRKNAPEIPYYLNCNIPIFLTDNSAYIRYIVKKTKKLGAVGLNINKSLCSEKLAKALRQNGLLLSLWTVTDLKGASKCLALNPDNVTCKNPDEVLSLVKNN